MQVIDFGSSCLQNERLYTYIQSRFYRSPEVILGLSYSHPIDMWSLGCILCELCTGKALFPGENDHEQLLCIMEVLGNPPPKMLLGQQQQQAKTGRLLLDSNGQLRITRNTKGVLRRPGTKSLSQVLGVRPLRLVCTLKFKNIYTGYFDAKSLFFVQWHHMISRVTSCVSLTKPGAFSDSLAPSRLPSAWDAFIVKLRRRDSTALMHVQHLHHCPSTHRNVTNYSTLLFSTSSGNRWLFTRWGYCKMQDVKIR